MDSPYSDGIGVPDLEMQLVQINERGSGDEDYYHWHRLGKERVQHLRRRRARQAVLKRQVRREQLLGVMARLEPCLIGMEACSGAHDFARELGKLGHAARIMAPQFVAPYRKSQKNDGNDAEAICEAVARPNMRFVTIKSEEQQALLVVHRVRKGLVDERGGLITRCAECCASSAWFCHKVAISCAHACHRCCSTNKSA
jgi:transposase